MKFVYPRLPVHEARELLERYSEMGAEELSTLADTRHPRAYPVPTGGPMAPTDRLQRVRQSALRAAEPWADRPVPRSEVAAFDRALGAAMHDAMDIIPADAAHEETWNFVTLVLLPDLAVQRFPERHHDRMLGGQRNAFRRSWWRREVLGELTTAGDPPLGEDELVGIFERAKMARSRRLVRMLAEEILQYPRGDRSNFARELLKLVRRQTGPRLLDALDDERLRYIVCTTGKQVSESLASGGLDVDGWVPSPSAAGVVLQADARDERTQGARSSGSRVHEGFAGLGVYDHFVGSVPDPENASESELCDGIRDVVSVEGPVLGDRLVHAYHQAAGGKRLTRAMRRTLNRSIGAARGRGLIVEDNPLRESGIKHRVYRLAEQPIIIPRHLGPRDLSQVPPNELAFLLEHESDGISDLEEAFRQVLARYGMPRLTSDRRQQLERAFKLLRE
jgi:hypothetical protein